MTDPFILAQLNRLPDFWRRREAAATHERGFEVFGHRVRLVTNAPVVLDSARLSAARYSRSQAAAPAITLRVLVDRQLGDQLLPPDWPTRLRCISSGPWLMVNCDPWVNAFADSSSRTAVALVSGSLAGEPYYLSRYVCDRFLLNIVMGQGLGRLHASCLYRDGTALLLNGPSESGKSTTALRLALAGYAMVSDGMTHVRTQGDRVELLGYPVGETKLRPDVVGWFPELAGRGQPMPFGEHTKLVLDLRQVDGVSVLEEAVQPNEVVLVYLVKAGGCRSAACRMDPEEMLERIWPEASFLEDEAVMASNLAAIRKLLAQARCHVVEIGSDPDSLVAVIGRL